MKLGAMYIAGKQPITEQQCQPSLLMSRATLLYSCTHWKVLFLPQPSLACMFLHFCIFVYLFIPSLKWERPAPQNEAAKTVCSLPSASTFWGNLSHSGHYITVTPFHWEWKIEKAFLSFLCAEMLILVLRSSALTPKGLCGADAIARNDNYGFYRAQGCKTMRWTFPCLDTNTAVHCFLDGQRLKIGKWTVF